MSMMKRSSGSAFRAAMAVLGAYLLSMLALGCMKPAPSLVGQGQLYRAGNARFDAFFSKLHELQVELDRAPKRDEEIRKAFATALGEQSSSSSSLAKAVRREAEILAQSGVFVRLDLADDDEATAQAELIVRGKNPSEKQQAVLNAVRTAGTEELSLSLRMARARRMLEELRFMARQLDQELDATFRVSGPRKKAEVRTNLDDGVALIPILRVRAEEVQNDSEKLLRKLTDAVRTDAPASGTALDRRGPAGSGRPRGAGPRGGAPAAPTVPPADKPGGPPPSDFEP
jgi:hypothetical protein